MNSLLKFAIEAHGGLAQWQKFSDLVADVDIHGTFCEQRGSAGMVPNSRVLLSLREPNTVVLMADGQGRLLIQPDLISHMDERGECIESLAYPRETMIREGLHTTWGMFRTAYFFGQTIRHSATAPFLYTYPGFALPTDSTPTDFEAPARVLLAYYGSDGLLRRTRYRAEVLGGVDMTAYISSYASVDGISIPTSRELFACDSEGRKAGTRVGHLRLLDPFFTD